MKIKVLRAIKLFLLVVATMSAHTPSQAALYQPEIPNKLKDFK